MMSPSEILTKVIKYVIALAAVMATIAGCERAIAIGTDTFGIVPVALVGTFVLGCIITAAVIHSRGP